MKKTNRILIAYLSIVILGYAFFFTSKTLIFGNIITQASELHSPVLYEGRNISLLSWNYSPTQNLMEVELDINNTTYGNEEYEFFCVFRPTNGESSVKIILSDNDYAVIQIENIPQNWNELSLRFTLEGVEAEPLRLYTNIDEVELIENITVKSDNDYYVGRLERNIGLFTEEINSINKKIENKLLLISNIEASILEDEASKKYKTVAEIEETNDIIKSKNDDIKSSRSQILSYENEIKELSAKIEKANEQIEDITVN